MTTATSLVGVHGIDLARNTVMNIFTPVLISFLASWEENDLAYRHTSPIRRPDPAQGFVNGNQEACQLHLGLTTTYAFSGATSHRPLVYLICVSEVAKHSYSGIYFSAELELELI